MLRTACLLAAVLAATAEAETGPSLVLRPDRPGRRGSLALEIERYLDGRASGGGGVDVTRVLAEGRVRVSPEGDRAVRIGYRTEHVGLDSADPRLPDGLADVSVAAGAALFTWESWDVRGAIGVGSASDEPFADRRGWYGILTVAGVREIRRDASWAVLVSYDGNRGFLPDWPLPGVSYRRFVHPGLRFTLGVPFSSVFWKPSARWVVEASGIPPIGGTVRVAFELSSTWTAMLRYRASRTYAHVEGQPRDERLVYRQQGIELGIVWTPRENATLTLAGGYGFARELETRTDAGRDFGGIELTDEPYVALRVTWDF